MRPLIRDFQSGVRLLRSQPGFSIVAVLTLAVGIGLSTTLFTVIHAAVLRPFPISDPDRLVRIDVRFPQPAGEPVETSPALQDVRDWRAGTTLFSHIAMDRANRSQIVDAGVPERLAVRWVSEDYFELFDIKPVIGRTISLEDAKGSAPAVVLLGHRYWQSHFAGDRAVVGREVRVDNEPFTIIGVVPAAFNPEVAVWQPLRYTPSFTQRRGIGAPVIGRLKPGVTLMSAQAELSRIASGTTAGTEALFKPLFAETVAGAASSARTLAGAVGAILLMACVNVAGLLLARGAARRRELAVRASLGASRGGLIRQLLMESLVLALSGGVVGVFLAWASMDALLSIIPIVVPETAIATLNSQVLLFSGGLAVATVTVFGVLPALRLSRVDVSAALAGADRHGGATLSRRTGQALIAVEVALAVIVLAGAGLMVRSFSRLVSVDLGFDPSAFVTMEVAPVDPSLAVAAAYYPGLLQAVRALPGVEAAGASNQLPIGGSKRAGSIPGPDGALVRVDHRLVLPGYFEAAGMKIADGRLLTESDISSGRPVLVINNAAVRKLFSGARAVGQIVPLAGQTYEIVGVIADVLQDGARSPVRPNVYAPYTGREELSRAPYVIFVRPVPGAGNLASQLRETALRIGPKVVVDHIRPGSAFVSEELTMPRQRMQLLGLVGVVGLAMTLVGIFSVTSYAVVRRTREIGVRMALGARPISAVAAIMRDAMWPVAIGLLAGLTGAFFLTRVMSSFLFETNPQDAATFASASLLLIVAAFAATWWPARRAAMIDPVTALRAD
ncbi:MAG: ABC transporter permease [Vicinamibacterales bacterium]